MTAKRVPLPAIDDLEVLGHLPRYQLIKQILKEKILSGELTPGDRLPSEMELAKAYRVSRITVSQTMARLATEGLIVRHQGKGTFVAETRKHPVRVAKITGFLEDVVRHARDVSTKLVQFSQVAPPADVAEVLSVPQDDLVWFSTRVRLIDGIPLTVAKNYVRGEWGKHLTAKDLETGRTVLELLESRAKLRIEYAHQTIQASVADAAIARALDLPVGFPLVEMRRVDVSKQHGAVEYVIGYYRGDRYMYSVDLVRHRSNGKNFWQHAASAK